MVFSSISSSIKTRKTSIVEFAHPLATVFVVCLLVGCLTLGMLAGDELGQGRLESGNRTRIHVVVHSNKLLQFLQTDGCCVGLSYIEGVVLDEMHPQPVCFLVRRSGASRCSIFTARLGIFIVMTLLQQLSRNKCCAHEDYNVCFRFVGHCNLSDRHGETTCKLVSISSVRYAGIRLKTLR